MDDTTRRQTELVAAARRQIRERRNLLIAMAALEPDHPVLDAPEVRLLVAGRRAR
jgi:hypothetical protein